MLNDDKDTADFSKFQPKTVIPESDPNAVQGGWVMKLVHKLSGGFIKRESQIRIFLTIAVIALFIATGYIFYEMSNRSTFDPATATPTEEIIQQIQQNAKK